LHLDFRISANGEELGLVQLIGLDTIILDQLVFGEFYAGNSYSRFTDGGMPWAQQAPTPGYSNQSSSVIPQEDMQVTLYPNPASDILHISLENYAGEETEIQLINMLGQVDRLYSGIYSEQLISLDVSHLEAGLYLLRMKTGDEWSVHRIIISR